MIDRDTTLSILRQCELLGLNRSSLYYRPQPIAEADLLLMRKMDEVHLTHPFLGARRLARLLQREGRGGRAFFDKESGGVRWGAAPA